MFPRTSSTSKPSFPRLLVSALAATSTTGMFTQPTVAFNTTSKPNMNLPEGTNMLFSRSVFPMIQQLVTCGRISTHVENVKVVQQMGKENKYGDGFQAQIAELQVELAVLEVLCAELTALPEVQELLQLIKSTWGCAAA
jgi:hypothetical protein